MSNPIAAPNLAGSYGEAQREVGIWSKRVSDELNERHQIGPDIAAAPAITLTRLIHHVTGAAAISEINVPTSFAGIKYLIADGNWSLVTGGNIAMSKAAGTGEVVVIIKDPVKGLWYVV